MKKYCVFAPVLRISQPGLADYLTFEILPRYGRLDCGHNCNHIYQVLNTVYQLGDELKNAGKSIDFEIVTTGVVYHDLGVLAPTKEGRKNHHLLAAEEVLADSNLKNFFEGGEIELIATIVREHRASFVGTRTHLLSKLVADADTIDSINFERICAYFQEIQGDKRVEERIATMFDHFTDKHGKDSGYASVDLPEAEDMWRAQITLLQDLLTDKEKFTAYVMDNYGEYF